MTSISSSFASPSRRQYVASGLFDTNIFQYSTYTDSQLNTRGRLVIHPSAVAGVNCLPGTILRENGKKLHTGTHPDLVDPTTNLPYTYLVGVYDVISGINGFINPNAPYFAVLNTDKSYQDDLTKEQVDASRNTLTAASGVYPYNNTSNQILGPPVNTAGDVLSGGYLEGKQVHAADLVHTPGFIVSGPDALISTPVTGVPIVYGAGTILANSNITSLANIYASNGVVHGSNVTAMSNVTAGRNIDASNGTITGSNIIARSNLTVNTGDITLSSGRLFLNTTNSGVAQLSTGSNPGGATSFRKLTVSAAACRTTSQVFLTYAGQNNVGFLSSEVIADGSFQIVSSSSNDGGSVRWMVIN